jgi:hypothetical protein
VAGLEAAARCWVKSARGTVLFIGGNTSTRREREDELNQILINQKGENPQRKELGHGLTRPGHALPECRVGLGPAQRHAALAEMGR